VNKTSNLKSTSTGRWKELRKNRVVEGTAILLTS
jgi:hypothetical protein